MSDAGGTGEAEYAGEGECDLIVGRVHLKLYTQTSHWHGVQNGRVVHTHTQCTPHTEAITQPPLTSTTNGPRRGAALLRLSALMSFA